MRKARPLSQVIFPPFRFLLTIFLLYFISAREERPSPGPGSPSLGMIMLRQDRVINQENYSVMAAGMGCYCRRRWENMRKWRVTAKGWTSRGKGFPSIIFVSGIVWEETVTEWVRGSNPLTPFPNISSYSQKHNTFLIFTVHNLKSEVNIFALESWVLFRYVKYMFRKV